MIYGINARKSGLLSDIARGLQETSKLSYIIDRLSGYLNNMDVEYAKVIRKKLYKKSTKIYR